MTVLEVHSGEPRYLDSVNTSINKNKKAVASTVTLSQTQQYHPIHGITGVEEKPV